MIKPFLVILSMFLLLSGCNTCDKNNCIEPPYPFSFRIIDRASKEDLVFSEYPRYPTDSIRLFYYQDEEEIELPLREIYMEDHYGELSNHTLPYVSAEAFTKDFYLQFNSQDIEK